MQDALQVGPFLLQEQILYLILATLCLAIDLFAEKKRLNKAKH